MINRVLIRMKVIQTLYSYLLVEKKFSLETLSESPTREKRFAYSLYQDMLVLMANISRDITRRGEGQPLAETRFMRRVLSDDQIKSRISKYKMQPFPFLPVQDHLADRIKESAIYKNFLKDRGEDEKGTADKVWKDMFDILIIPDPEVNDIISKMPGYTLKGVDRMREMMEDTFSNFMASQEDDRAADKALGMSLDKARELYIRMLMLPVELTRLRADALEENRAKFMLSEEDINPSLKFVENQMVEKLMRSALFEKATENGRYSWISDERVMMDSLLKKIMDSEEYREYMAESVSTLKGDCKFWRDVFKKIIFNDPLFLETLEDKSVFWNDDLEIIGTFVIKTIRRIEEGVAEPLLEKYKDEEDARFGFELMRYVLKNRESYRALIDRVIEGGTWDSERLAFMDVLIAETAIAEILNFPSVPLTVSINEYIEIAKSYSTSKSGMFVHGILGGAVRILREEDKTFIK